MKIDTMSYPVTKVELSHQEASDWIQDEGSDLIDVNSAIDEATSNAETYGKAYVLIEISKPR